MKRSFCAAALVSLLAVPAAAAQEPAGDWARVYEQQSGPVFLDRASVSRDGHLVTLRSRADLAEALEDGTRTMFVRFRFDCRARTFDLLEYHFLGADGGTIGRLEIPADQRQAEPIAPDSANHAIAEQVCGQPAAR